jgi:hypothetical protein
VKGKQAVLVTVAFILMSDAACTSKEPPTRHDDGGSVTPREACNIPSMNCYNTCFKREADLTCTGCCYDQRYLCDSGQQYSFESCNRVAPRNGGSVDPGATAPRP